METHIENIKVEKPRLWKSNIEFLEQEYPIAKEILKPRQARTINTFINHLIELGSEVYEEIKTKKGEEVTSEI